MLRKLGGFVSDKWDTLRGIPEYDHQFPIFGLDAAGKSTLLYRLFYSEHVLTLPDHGFRTETVSVPNYYYYYPGEGGQGRDSRKELRFRLWDVAGQVGIIPLWRVYVNEMKAKGVIFVVDSTDRQRLLYTKNALWRLFGHYDDTEAGRELVLLVFANKQDQEDAMTVMEVMYGLDLEGLAARALRGQGGRRWHIRGTVATTGEGLVEGLLWLDVQLRGGRSQGEGQTKQ
ncbi:MAG: ADP-ribosylation factor [Linnemannia elongata]|nr:MAG: ADP-ribosylation factor [Linnemannia elongata]